MAEFEHAAQILFDEPAEEGSEAQREGVFDFVAEDGGVGSVGAEDVLVAPRCKGAFFLDVGEEAVVLVFGVDCEPGFVKRPEEEAEFDAGAGLEPTGAGDDFHLLPGGKEKGEDVVTFVEGEEFFDGDREAGLMDEFGHWSIDFTMGRGG